MKKLRIFSYLLIMLLILPLFNLTSTTKKAKASYYNGQGAFTGYEFMRVIDSTTPFYADFEGKNLLFYLPYTYYVRVLEKGEQLTHVECVGENIISIDGFVPTDMLYDDQLTVSSPYANVSLKIKNTATLFSDPDGVNAIHIVYGDRELKYYGTITKKDGARLFYVNYYNKIGYVKETDVLPFTISNHPNELTFIKTEEPDLPTSAQPNNPVESEDGFITSLRIIIFGCLIIAGGIALAVALKNKPKAKKEGSYYDENDYE